MRELVEIILSFIFGAILIVVAVFMPLYLFEKYIVTPNFGKVVRRPVKYNFLAGGCFVNIGNNNWVSCDKYIGIIEDKSK